MKNKVINNYKISLYIIIIVLIILDYLISSFNKNINIKIRNMNITNLLENEINFDESICRFINGKLKNRIQPFEYEEELSFIISLILCKIPFSFVRFGDGEEHIMSGKPFATGRDKWVWNNNDKQFQISLIKSASICKRANNFIAISCKNWYNISKSVLSFSKCTSSRYMSYATLFINKNYQFFENWLVKFINSKNRWKIILIANSLINKDIKWAYKYYPVSERVVERWNEISYSLLPKLENEAMKNNLIFFVSAGPASNIIISNLITINNKNIYIDLGSAIEIITKGFSTRSYINNGKNSYSRCESFYLKNQIPIYSG